MAQTATTQSTRELVLARRRAMSSGGKAALAAVSSAGSAQSTASASARVRTAAAAVAPAASGRAASKARREAMSSGGKATLQGQDRIRTADSGGQGAPAPGVQQATDETRKGCGCGCKDRDATDTQDIAAMAAPVKPAVKAMVPGIKSVNIKRPAGRAASLARREAMSSRGKAGISKNGMSTAQTTRASNPGISSRELAKTLREERSKNGRGGQKTSAPCGRVRKQAAAETGAAEDQSWKVGASETAEGQTVTGTMVGRSVSVTGDEPSTCRAITGTEYLGADIFRNFCQRDPSGTPGKVRVTQTSHGNRVSGNRMGRGTNVTGNEPGTCKRVTGNEYVSAEESQGFCGEFMAKGPRKVIQSGTARGKVMTGTSIIRSEKVTGDEYGMNRALTGTQYKQPEDIGSAPRKVGVSATLRGGNVTGTMVGRRERMTGDEPGSCKDVTGDDYIGQEQYGGFCKSAPQPQDRKVGVSGTLKGMAVTGTMTGRSGSVTGDEPGSCKAVTGTPYAGADQYGGFCSTDEATVAVARTRPLRSTPGSVMTGLQPGIGGTMTGDRKGACEPLTGTPYIGADQFADVCPSTPADTASPDFPQSMGTAPWQQFSVTSPSGGAQAALDSTGVTGNRYEQGHITGPFGMATGKVTGTEEARFGQDALGGDAMRPVVAEDYEGRVKARITGEGQDAGLKITGDDWERVSSMTGTEGRSANLRNPTMRMGMASAMKVEQKRNEELPTPSSKVTGSSGNTEKGSLITYSGGARG
ncbi:MAG: CsoS2 family carboxysome shell protein [Gammaproteobacteria bacterium]|nr:MAG: CsoS2 family carboxysome shell protein [Gammaproteobacteria bacterium]